MIVGIDLGTTNSAIGLWRNGAVELVPNSVGDFLTPSAVSLDDHGAVLVGIAARERQVTHPQLSATGFKRYMGSQRVTRLGRQSFLPEDLSALVLRNLKADAETYLQAPVTEAVITVPAYFNDIQRKATRRAGELAGLKVERLLNEPTAAALAYGIHRLGGETKFLVFDLGGGTFDVSILEIFEGILEVRASTGDNHLGGEDFNEVIVDEFFAKHASAFAVTSKNAKPTLYQRVREQAERARRQLTTQSEATMSVSWQGITAEMKLSVDDFERLAAGLLQRLREPILRALRDGQLSAESLTEICMVGGATRMPLIRRAVTRMFGRFSAQGLNPDEAVVMGAAIQGGLKAREADLREVILTDVSPYTLGVEVVERGYGGALRGGVFSPIIERNTVVPASRMKTLYTIVDQQREVTCKIYQGESRNVEDNIALGEINVPVPPRRAGEVPVEVRFSYDINGLLEVDLRVAQTGETRQLVILGQDQGPSSEDLAARRAQLAKLKVHPRDADVNRSALARAERCYEQFLGERRELVGRWIAEFEAVLDTQDPRAAQVACEELHHNLDRLDGERYL